MDLDLSFLFIFRHLRAPSITDLLRIQYLLGGIPTSEKYEFVSWDYELPNKYGNSLKKSMVPVTTNHPLYGY